jgi:hypothetical protein
MISRALSSRLPLVIVHRTITRSSKYEGSSGSNTPFRSPTTSWVTQIRDGNVESLQGQRESGFLDLASVIEAIPLKLKPTGIKDQDSSFLIAYFGKPLPL